MEDNAEVDNKKPENNGFNRRTFLWVVPSLATALFAWLFLRNFPSDISKALIKGKVTLLRDKKTSTTQKPSLDAGIGETPFVNTRSNVTHYPTSYIFNYYSKTKDEYIKPLEVEELRTSAGTHVLNRQYSGIVLECLALRCLARSANAITPAHLESATDLVEEAFTGKYGYKRLARGKDRKNGEVLVLHNRFNWRLYELLVQLLALNTRLTDEEGVSRFKQITKLSNITRKHVPPRCTWMLTDAELATKVQGIRKFGEQYMERLVCRYEAAVAGKRTDYKCRARIPVG